MNSAVSHRLQLKRAFCRYYLQVCTATISDPTDAYSACREYLSWREEALGRPLTEVEHEREMLQLVGELEQDLMRRGVEYKVMLAEESLYDRLQECMVVARKREAV
ncbi:MAG: hypothetical protein GX604_05555 [Actinobacteria bacterium]|nr:hypothetical protein [Actinomycetota bacterium]